jgi:hypothetical protein
MALHQNIPAGASIGSLKRRFGISHKTICRWIAHFRDEFPSSAQWQRLRGRVCCSGDNSELPGGLVVYFLQNSESPETGVVECLLFLATGLQPV